MSLRGRVGRHTNQGGRQCQNWDDDQRTVIGLLLWISDDEGGGSESFHNNVGPVRSGTCSDALYAAIVKFEARQFPGQRNGYVDPGGAMLKRMEDLAAAASKRVYAETETKLDVLRRNVLNIANVVAGFHGDARWTAGDRVQLDPLVQMVVAHIDNLKGIKDSAGKPLERLPWYGEVFGRVFLEYATNHSYSITPDGEKVRVVSVGEPDRIVDALMRFGSPVQRHTGLIALKVPALILFDDGLCFPMHSKMVTSAADAHEDARDGFSAY